jgi:hypothetical protein
MDDLRWTVDGSVLIGHDPDDGEAVHAVALHSADNPKWFARALNDRARLREVIRDGVSRIEAMVGYAHDREVQEWLGPALYRLRALTEGERR